MAMDYPDAKDWSLYYAQSVSLTRFLVEQGPPEQFIQFVHELTARRDRERPSRHLPHRRVRRASGTMDRVRATAGQTVKAGQTRPASSAG